MDEGRDPGFLQVPGRPAAVGKVLARVYRLAHHPGCRWRVRALVVRREGEGTLPVRRVGELVGRRVVHVGARVSVEIGEDGVRSRGEDVQVVAEVARTRVVVARGLERRLGERLKLHLPVLREELAAALARRAQQRRRRVRVLPHGKLLGRRREQAHWSRGAERRAAADRGLVQVQRRIAGQRGACRFGQERRRARWWRGLVRRQPLAAVPLLALGLIVLMAVRRLLLVVEGLRVLRVLRVRVLLRGLVSRRKCSLRDCLGVQARVLKAFAASGDAPLV
mmetsp:Transcript_41422/g.110515  ORF Transcript_41422/g.110515 Transcript_41422/m.110515 type:complete len:279 (+) Transcript_41422:253-1089(+)